VNPVVEPERVAGAVSVNHKRAEKLRHSAPFAIFLPEYKTRTMFNQSQRFERESMSTEHKPLSTLSRSVPADIEGLFGEPPLLSTEDPSLYWAMLDRFIECVEPKNVIEWLWVKDIVDLCWEIARLRRYRALFIEFRRGKSFDEVQSETGSARLMLYENSEVYQDVEKFLASAELRRDRILRELDFRRERIAPLLRKTSDELIDARADAVPLAAE
jgi:hypothetical protein